MPMDHKRPVDMREVIARIVDDSDFLEFGRTTGRHRLRPRAHRGLGRRHHHQQRPDRSAGATKATHFIQACCQSRTPMLYLNNTTGFMVGKRLRRGRHDQARLQDDPGGDQRHVPQITIYCGASFGAGNYGMCGRGFHPRFCFSWPNAKTAVMGGEQAAETMAIVTEAGAARKGGKPSTAQLDEPEGEDHRALRQPDGRVHDQRPLLDDGVIDPRDTRAVLAKRAGDLPRGRARNRSACSSRWRGHERAMR
jgi:geranyl-CoA carboxylase beta subunit